MVIKTLTCNFSQQKIYPGHGKTFVRLDAKVCNRPRVVVVPPPQQPQRDGRTEMGGALSTGGCRCSAAAAPPRVAAR